MGLRPHFYWEKTMARTMLYKPGRMITCGQLAVDYIIVDDDEVKSHLKKGWVRTPEETTAKQKDAKAEEDGKNKG
nr:MAG TPA: hypothetical protein [Caudoviricetes sp.]